MDTFRRAARSLRPMMDTLEARLVLSRLGPTGTPAYPGDEPNVQHQGDRSIRMSDVPDSGVAPPRASLAADPATPTNKPQAHFQSGGAVGGGAPMMGPAPAHADGAPIYAVAGTSTSSTSSWTSSVSFTGVTSSSMSGGVTSNAGFFSDSSTGGTSSLTDLTSTSGGTGNAAFPAAVAAGHSGFMAAGEAVPSPVALPGSNTPSIHPDGFSPDGFQEDLANYQAMFDTLQTLRQNFTNASQQRATDVTQRNTDVANFFAKNGISMSLSDFDIKINNQDPKKWEWEVSAKFEAKINPGARDAAKQVMEDFKAVLADDYACAKAFFAVSAKRMPSESGTLPSSQNIRVSSVTSHPPGGGSPTLGDLPPTPAHPDSPGTNAIGSVEGPPARNRRVRRR